MNKGNNIRETTYINKLIFIEEKLDTEEDRRSLRRKPFFEFHSGGMETVDKKKILFLGIIDIFTQYG